MNKKQQQQHYIHINSGQIKTIFYQILDLHILSDKLGNNWISSFTKLRKVQFTKAQLPLIITSEAQSSATIEAAEDLFVWLISSNGEIIDSNIQAK